MAVCSANVVCGGLHSLYIRKAHKAEKIVLDLGVERKEVVIASEIVGFTVLDKGTGAWTLTLQFYDETRFTLDSTELSTGSFVECDIKKLMITNTAQSGVTVKFIVYYQRAA